jgi:hypothetical protein
MIKPKEKKALKRIKRNRENNIKSVVKKGRIVLWTEVSWFGMVTTDGFL